MEYVFALLEKLVVIVVLPVMVPLVCDQLLNVVVYPVRLVGEAVTFCSFEKFSVFLEALYVVP